ncbi:uncharacterized protein METZ01_LOCUS299478 [marine metagenome]|uniref:Phage tail assembly chaperone-like domain-containing protein n=1 Tax=marine metagenome TaxID=408172 RepID=A0A382MCF7_9ZZZZ
MPRFKMVDGERIQFTAEEETARDTEEAAWAAGEDDRAMASLREDRDRRLAATDWYGVSDLTMSADMTTYRQDLRDLPAGKSTKAHVDAVTWPTKPAA